MVVLEHSELRRMENLEAAQAMRMERVRVLKALRDCELEPAALLVETPECLLTMFTFEFLRHIPRLGSGTIREINRRAILDRVNLAMSLGSLGGRRVWLAETLVRTRRQGRFPLASRPQG